MIKRAATFAASPVVDGVTVAVYDGTNPIMLTVSKQVGRGRVWHAPICLSIADARAIARAMDSAADAALAAAVGRLDQET